MPSDPPRLTRSGRALQPPPKPPPEPLLPNTQLSPNRLPTRRRALPHRASLPPGIAGARQQNFKSSKVTLKKGLLALDRRPSAATQLSAAARSPTTSTRSRTLPRVAVEKQKVTISKKQEAGQEKAAQLLEERVAATPLPPTAQAPSTYFTDTSTATKLRSLPHRTSDPNRPVYRQKRAPSNPKELEPQQEEQQPPPKKLPSSTTSIPVLLSAEELEEKQERRKAAMPAALRRPSTSHRRRLSDKENKNARADSKAVVLIDGLPNSHSPRQINAALHAHNAVLTNGSLPESTHTHPSQIHRPPQPPSRTEEKDREKALERNIDSVVFGDVRFKAWYPSWYPKEIIGEKGLDGKGTGIVVQTLYVCKKCFGYGKQEHEWIRHCQLCQKEVPGQRIYMHGGDAKEGVWSVWEVDGGVDTIFCQNLSLFAKLFLDNKSVFFDVSGFNYFLLVHNPTSQIIGFFSKEKMSWDNNNLACILIFPPWQRKGLGSILMGVSYEISRREEILGGPEKPISDLGKKGYKMFWGREIARWLLEAKETDRKKGKGMVTVGDVSRGTWIHSEDCLGVLREMGVVERAGKGRGEVERVLLDKEKIRQWVEKMGLGLERVVDREGFAEGYGYKEVVEEEAAGD